MVSVGDKVVNGRDRNSLELHQESAETYRHQGREIYTAVRVARGTTGIEDPRREISQISGQSFAVRITLENSQ